LGGREGKPRDACAPVENYAPIETAQTRSVIVKENRASSVSVH
jgi:hypothetical protein